MARREAFPLADKVILEDCAKKPRHDLHLKEIRPMTLKQNHAFKEHEKGQNLLFHGSAGTGKTFLGLYFGLHEVINTKQYKNITIIRSAVEVRKVGFLPGSEEEKSESYEIPYRGICSELFGNDKAYEILKKREQIDFKLTSFLRGTTLDDTFIVIDECSNMDWAELSTVITRMGNNTKLVFCGDWHQTDFKFEDEKVGFVNFKKILEKMPSFSCIEFGVEDIVRGKIVKEFLIEAYKQGIM